MTFTTLAIRAGAWTLRRPLIYDLIVLAIAALALAYMGVGPAGTAFWLILGAFAAACIVYEIAYAVHCWRRGQRSGEVRAQLADTMLEQSGLRSEER